MPSSITLTGTSQWIDVVPGFRLHAPGVEGELQIDPSDDFASRSLQADSSDPVIDALAGAGMKQLHHLEMKISQDAVSRSLSTSPEPLTYKMSVPDTPSGHAMWYQNEAGEVKWIFPKKDTTEPEVVFEIPADSENGESEGSRSLTGFSKRIVMRILSWPLEYLADQAVSRLVKLWEESKHPYEWQAVQPGQIGGTVEWSEFAGKRVLVLVHGTISSVEGSFGELVNSELFREMYESYEGRVIGFHHPTLHHTPYDNVKQMLQMIPSIDMEWDIITTSRGGLVGRELAQYLATGTGNQAALKLGKMIMIAAPNRGSILSNPDNFEQMLNRMTTLALLLPPNLLTIFLDGILLLVKALGLAALTELPGLRIQVPNNPYLIRLNGGLDPIEKYHSIVAQFDPAGRGLKSFIQKVGDKWLDALFGEENDGLVPSAGTYDVSEPDAVVTAGVSNGSELPTGGQNIKLLVPEIRRQVYKERTDMNHLNYFTHDEVSRQIMDWLGNRNTTA